MLLALSNYLLLYADASNVLAERARRVELRQLKAELVREGKPIPPELLAPMGGGSEDDSEGSEDESDLDEAYVTRHGVLLL